jgi:hypothetical protein
VISRQPYFTSSDRYLGLINLLDNLQVSDSYISLGNLYLLMYQQEQAETYFHKGLAIAQQKEAHYPAMLPWWDWAKCKCIASFGLMLAICFMMP